MRLRPLLLLTLALVAFAPERAAAQEASVCAAPQLSDAALDGVSRNEKWEELAEARADRLDRARDNIVALGDSMAVRWPPAIQENLFGQRFANLGISGDRVENVQWRLPLYDIAAARPRAVFVFLGTNNLRTRDSATTIHDRLTKLICDLKGKIGDAPLVVFEILPRGEGLAFRASDVETVNDRLEADQKRLGFRLLQIHDAVLKSCDGADPCPLFVDGLHLSDEGYRLVGDRLKAILEEVAPQR